MPRKLKRLPVPSWFLFELKRGRVDRHTQEYPLPGTLAPAPGDGWWYDRDAKVSWIQVGDLMCGQAPEDFSYELQLCDTRPLRDVEMAAIDEMRRLQLPLTLEVRTQYDVTRELAYQHKRSLEFKRRFVNFKRSRGL